MCEVANSEFNRGLGCNISVSVSDDLFASNVCDNNDVSPKRGGFLDSLIRKNSRNNDEKKSKDAPTGWSNIFAKKTDTKKEQEEEEKMAQFIAQLRFEGRSDEEIAMHLSHINDIRPAPPVSPKRNLVAQLFQAIKDEFSLTQYYPEPECDLQGVTIGISSAPFYGAPDMTYEELSCLEPVYVGAKCINNLPTCKHDGTPLPGNQTNCPVCLCEFTNGEKLKSLPCVHFFHKECIDRWLLVGHTCPMCKMIVE